MPVLLLLLIKCIVNINYNPCYCHQSNYCYCKVLSRINLGEHSTPITLEQF